MAQQAPDLGLIRQIEGGVYPAFAMYAGVQLDLFTPLDAAPLGVEALADTLDVQPRHLQLLLDNLVLAGLLTVMDGQYANGDEAGRSLVRGKPGYLGARFAMWADFWHAALQTADSIRMGRPQAAHDYARLSEEEQLGWLQALNQDALAVGQTLAERYHLGTCGSLLDVGGGLGGVSVALARACPTSRVTLVDLPTVTPRAEQFLAEAEVRDRVSTLSVDLLRSAPPGHYDAAVLLKFVQVFRAEDAQTVLRNVGAALRPGGTMFIVGAILDASRLTPAHTVRINLVMLNAYDGGQAYTEGEYRQWLTAAGCTDIRRDEPINGMSVIIARKA